MYIKPASGIKIKWILRDEKLDSLLKAQHTSVVECLITLVDIKHAKASFKFILSVVDGMGRSWTSKSVSQSWLVYPISGTLGSVTTK